MYLGDKSSGDRFPQVCRATIEGPCDAMILPVRAQRAVGRGRGGWGICHNPWPSGRWTKLQPTFPTKYAVWKTGELGFGCIPLTRGGLITAHTDCPTLLIFLARGPVRASEEGERTTIHCHPVADQTVTMGMRVDLLLVSYMPGLRESALTR